ncbi:COPII subunit [Cladochytrium tenue]|nr:COPII subunit [Cladochytrium tenue]
MILSSEKLDRAGLYLLENGMDIFIWVARGLQPQLCQMIFDRPSYESIVSGKATLPVLDNDLSQRITAFVSKIRSLRLQMMTTFPNLYIVKEDGDPALKMEFLSHLVEDRVDSSYSYFQFITFLRDKKLTYLTPTTAVAAATEIAAQVEPDR